MIASRRSVSVVGPVCDQSENDMKTQWVGTKDRGVFLLLLIVALSLAHHLRPAQGWRCLSIKVDLLKFKRDRFRALEREACALYVNRESWWNRVHLTGVSD